MCVAQYALATCSLTTLNLSYCRWKRLVRSLLLKGPVCSVCRSGRSLDLEAHCRRDRWPGWHGFHRSPTGQSSRRGNCDYRATGDGFVVMDYHEQNIFDTLGFDTVDVVFDNLGFPCVR